MNARLAPILLLAGLAIGCDKGAEPTVAVAPGATPTTPAAKPAPVESWVEVPAAGLVDRLKTEATAAIAAGKQPVLYLHASWCKPCVAIEKFRHEDASMQAAFSTVHIVAVDLDALDEPTLTALGIKPDSIPVFHKLGADGKPTGQSITGGAWEEDIPANMAPPLTAFFKS